MSMTTAEKIVYVQTMVDNDPDATDARVAAYLTKAKSDCLHQRFPFGVPADVTDVPEAYEIIQCDLAIRAFLRRGGEGEQIHNENGIHRHYGSVNDADLLSKIPSVVKI